MRYYIAAGGRQFMDYDRLSRVLDKEFADIDPSEIIIVSGCAEGADELGERYAHEHELKCLLVPPRWKKKGEFAWKYMNQEMAEIASGGEYGKLIVFWDGETQGTEHMIYCARVCNLEVDIHYYDKHNPWGETKGRFVF